ncbi:hypothetical protein SAMN04515674_109114 [Pseudarcicella hirudinis]|uniref:Uncharacterized protein n=1 Tax=Pseudarcicella hirudinis TaxID=1079859 RepID=A0A1I5VH90_9BACT|nr:hypothetical protein SAMN04515674_109114 [Pseudarcicella hirudinis]
MSNLLLNIKKIQLNAAEFNLNAIPAVLIRGKKVFYKT